VEEGGGRGRGRGDILCGVFDAEITTHIYIRRGIRT